MSGVHPYCIVPAGHAPAPGLTGVDGLAVRARPVGSVSVWLSSAPEPPAKDLERIRQHHAVVQSSAEVVTPVPVRYGEWSPDEETLDESIRPRVGRFHELLTALSGRLEYGIAVGPPARHGQRGSDPRASTPDDRLECPSPAGQRLEDAPTPADPGYPVPTGEPSLDGGGRRYLRALADAARSRRRVREEREALLEALRSRLDGVVAEERLVPGGRPSIVSVAHLVQRAEHERYLRLVRAWAEEEVAGYEVRIMGPWPPYSFALP